MTEEEEIVNDWASRITKSLCEGINNPPKKKTLLEMLEEVEEEFQADLRDGLYD